MKIKTWDKIIIALLLILSFVPYLFLKLLLLGDYDMTYARVTVDGKLYKEIPLTGQVKHTAFVIETVYGSNTAVIENEKITVSEANCPDRICAKTGFIEKPGQSITCLPHKLYIEIVGKLAEEDEDTIDVNAY